MVFDINQAAILYWKTFYHFSHALRVVIFAVFSQQSLVQKSFHKRHDYPKHEDEKGLGVLKMNYCLRFIFGNVARLRMWFLDG